MALRKARPTRADFKEAGTMQSSHPGLASFSSNPVTLRLIWISQRLWKLLQDLAVRLAGIQD
jgi:hypothetical protein